jgi:hypothetical protein
MRKSGAVCSALTKQSIELDDPDDMEGRDDEGLLLLTALQGP